LWLHSLKVAQLLRSAACLHTNQSRSYLNHLVIWCNIDSCWRNHCCSGKAVIIIIYSEYVSVALFIQHAKRMPRTVLMSMTCLALPYFSTLSLKRHDFFCKKKDTERKMCALIFSTKVFWNIFYSKKNSARHYHKYT